MNLSVAPKRARGGAGLGLACLCGALVLGGCAGGGSITRPPDTLARDYADALRRGDADAVYAMLDEETRASVDLETLRAQMAETQAELEEQAQAIEAALLDPQLVSTGARVPLAHDQHATLVVEGTRWRILGTVLDAVSLATPRDAVLAFRSALGRRSLRGVERVLARQPRSEIEAQIQRFLMDTEDELDLDVDIQGNDATVRTASGRVIRLVREAGEWHVLSVE